MVCQFSFLSFVLWLLYVSCTVDRDLRACRRAYGNYEDFDVFAGADTAEKVRINGYFHFLLLQVLVDVVASDVTSNALLMVNLLKPS